MECKINDLNFKSLNEEGILFVNKMKFLFFFYLNWNIFLIFKCLLYNIIYRCLIYFLFYNLVIKKSFLLRFVEDLLMFINFVILDEIFCKLIVFIVNRIDIFYVFFFKSWFLYVMGGVIIFFGYLIFI